MKLLTKAEAQAKLDSQKADKIAELSKVQQQISSVVSDKQTFITQMNQLRDEVTGSLQAYIEDCNTQKRSLQNELHAIQVELDARRKEIAPTMEDAKKRLDLAKKTLADVTVRETILLSNIESYELRFKQLEVREKFLSIESERYEKGRSTFNAKSVAFDKREQEHNESVRLWRIKAEDANRSLSERERLVASGEKDVRKRIQTLSEEAQRQALERAKLEAEKRLVARQLKTLQAKLT